MRLFIHDWTTVSPIGIGKKEFIKSINQKSLITKAPLSEPVNFDKFNKKVHLGKKGVRNMDDLGAYATTASQLLVNENSDAFDDKSKVGVILGTATGSIKSQIDFIRDIHEQEMIEWINPIQFPQTVMNCAAGQVSIWHQFTGVNTTISSGFHSGISAIEYANNSFCQKRIGFALVGCVEEFSAYSNAILPKKNALSDKHKVGEGCAMFLLSDEHLSKHDTEIIKAKRLSYFNRLSFNEKLDELSSLIQQSLVQQGFDNNHSINVCFNCFSDDELFFVKEICKKLSFNKVDLLCSNNYVADCLSATSGMQVAILLAHQSISNSANKYGLTVTFDPSGRVGILILKYGEKS
ncbi:beta-ketoacyl synthase N-terminal-like domain-containing protein [Aliikangiella sp. IMCC44359]|uniref:beta-ketoacyl synthase N-terminal-like domain-containing protein n=1 Tax=Aliikangiella sp. IMCC44359 TaxID=3459125 RepID=UPI00403B18CF